MGSLNFSRDASSVGRDTRIKAAAQEASRFEPIKFFLLRSPQLTYSSPHTITIS